MIDAVRFRYNLALLLETGGGGVRQDSAEAGRWYVLYLKPVFVRALN